MESNSLQLKVMYCRDLSAFNFFQKLNVYVVVSIVSDDPKKKVGKKQEHRTAADKEGDGNPEWKHEMVFELDEALFRDCDALFVQFDLRHEGLYFGDKTIGEVRVLLKDLLEEPYGIIRFVNYQVQSPEGRPNGVLNFSYKVNWRGKQASTALSPENGISGYSFVQPHQQHHNSTEIQQPYNQHHNSAENQQQPYHQHHNSAENQQQPYHQHHNATEYQQQPYRQHHNPAESQYPTLEFQDSEVHYPPPATHYPPQESYYPHPPPPPPHLLPPPPPPPHLPPPPPPHLPLSMPPPPPPPPAPIGYVYHHHHQGPSHAPPWGPGPYGAAYGHSMNESQTSSNTETWPYRHSSSWNDR